MIEIASLFLRLTVRVTQRIRIVAGVRNDFHVLHSFTWYGDREIRCSQIEEPAMIEKKEGRLMTLVFRHEPHRRMCHLL